MTEATVAVSTMASSTAPLTTIDNFFSSTYEFFNQHRTAILVVTGTILTGWFYNKLWVNRKFYPSNQIMTGKTVLITGANSGIGYETAKDLLRRGARVILVCRNMERGQDAVQKLCYETKCDEKNLRLMKCDLCSLDSVREFAKLFNEQENKLDVLICNAGLVWSPHLVTKDGFNSVIQGNYLGHFLLTNLLLDKLKQSRPSRIINVSSGAHKMRSSIDWSDVFTQFKSSTIIGVYGMSKLLQILSTYKLKQDLLESEGINTFAVHPGFVKTSLDSSMRDALGFFKFMLIYPIVNFFKLIFAKTPRTGSRTTIYCAVEPSLENSRDIYFENCSVSQPTKLAIDDESANRLWKLTKEQVGL